MSSLGGSARLGKRSRSARTVATVSSTDRVVCDSQTTWSGSRTVTLATSSGPSTAALLADALAGGARFVRDLPANAARLPVRGLAAAFAVTERIQREAVA